MKWKIHFWRWSSIPICIEWRRSGFGRSLTIQGKCRNTSNPRWTWRDESAASAALVLVSLSVLYRLWSRQGCCSSEGTWSPGAFFGHSHLIQKCRPRWCRSLYSVQSASDAAKTGLQRLKLPSAQRPWKYLLSALGFCWKMRGRSACRSTSFNTSRCVCHCSSCRF